MIPLESNPLYACSQDLFNYCLETCQPKIAIDVGANDGGYTNIMLKQGYVVTAFEPVPDVFEKLRQRYADNRLVHCVPAAASDRLETLHNVTVLCAWTIGDPAKVPLSVCPSYEGKPGFDVETVTLDSLDWPGGVGIIKLDVDGYEHKVLRGAWELLTTYQPPILCEFSGYIAKCGDDPRQFVEDIFRLGYHVFSCDGKQRFSTWREIEPCYPFDTSFDVMLIPAHLSDMVLLKFNQPTKE